MSTLLETAFTASSLLVPFDVGLGLRSLPTISDAKYHALAVVIGLVSQFCFMPLIAYALIKIFQVDTGIAEWAWGRAIFAPTVLCKR